MVFPSALHVFATATSTIRSLSNPYYWPSGRGSVGQYTSSNFTAAFNLQSSLAWSWHDPNGLYINSPSGVAIDDQQAIYLTSLDGVRKFSQNGTLLWTHGRHVGPNGGFDEEMPDASSLYNGVLYTTTTAGWVMAMDMQTGSTVWETKLVSTDGNNGFVSAHGGVVITGSDAQDNNKRGGGLCCGTGDQLVTGLNATDGTVLWNFSPDAPVWNFLASFVGDGTFTFQDLEGRAYRCNASDGTLIWKAGGEPFTWTDGSSQLGPNGLVYAMHNIAGFGNVNTPGRLSAYHLADGSLAWTTLLPQPPNNVPAIGKLAGQTGLSVVQPIGQQVHQGAPTFVYALDADTGVVQWIFNGPTQQDVYQQGDNNPIAVAQRASIDTRMYTLPNPWGAPAIDGAGTVYIASEEGPFFALRDANGDGVISGNDEVAAFQTGSCPAGSAGPAIAPQLMAVTSQDALYVFTPPLA